MIYFDYNATTPVDQRVVDAMQPFFNVEFGNPASNHVKGHAAKSAVDDARSEVAGFVGAKQDEIVFTDCATESNNLALIGLALRNKDSKDHIITTKIEHQSVMNPCRYLESLGFKVTYVSVDPYGVVDFEELKNKITDRTLVVSVIFANNQIGTIQPMKEIGELTREMGIFFHTDAAQAVGHIPVNVDDLNIDLMSISAHKFYGPKGVGALFLRNRSPKVELVQLLYGGSQEKGMRPGTLNVPYIVGIAEACRIAKKEMKDNNSRFEELTDRIFRGLKEARDDIKLNGHPDDRLKRTLNIEIPGIDNKWLASKAKDLCFATGSACSEFHDEPSHILRAIGLSDERISNCIRISVGPQITDEDVDYFVRTITSFIK